MSLNDVYLALYEQIKQRVITDNISDDITSLLKTLPNINFDDSNNSPLYLAIERNDVKCVQFLLAFNPNLVFKEEKSASKLAWDLKHYECLAVLLNSEAPYPEKFNLNDIVSSDRHIVPVVRSIESFHKNIKYNEVDNVEKFIEEHQWIKYAYDMENKSALRIALEFRRFDIYSLLQSKGYDHGIDVEFIEIRDNLYRSEKRKIRDAKMKYFKAIESSHIFFLLSVTKVGSNLPTDEDYKNIKMFYNELDKIPEVRVILKTLECDEKLQIVFDFINPHIQSLDPIHKTHTKGATYGTGYIYIAASNYEDKFFEIIGTLAHEFAHRALDLIYQNHCKPYKTDSLESEENFEKIVLHLQKIVENSKENMDPIIRNVYENYPRGRWHSELIVRVPHLLARYSNDHEILENIRTDHCKKLFTFYEHITMRDIKEQFELIKPKNIIKKINDQFKYMKKLLSNDYLLTEVKVKYCVSMFESKMVNIQIIESNVPFLVLRMLFQFLKPTHESTLINHHILSEFEFVDSNFIEIQKALKSKVKPFLIVYADVNNIVNNESFNNFIEIFENQSQIILIMRETAFTNIKECIDKKILACYEVNFLWNDLEKESQLKILERKVTFQGKLCQIKTLFSIESSVCEYLPLYNIVEDIDIVISEFNEGDLSTQDFYIERNFDVKLMETDLSNDENAIGISENRRIYTKSMNLCKFLDYAEETKMIIISDVAGSGKTTALSQIAKTLKNQFLTRWIKVVDLKNHVQDFESIEMEEKSIKGKKKSKRSNQDSNDCVNFESFLMNILKFNEKVLEEKLFAQLFRVGKVIIMFDGFDEISPTYKKLLLKLFKSFKTDLGNQLWVTSRSHLQHELESNLHQLSCKISPLTKSDQKNFLIKCWKIRGFLHGQGNLEIKAKLLLEKLSYSLIYDRSDPIGIPLLLKIIAEIFADNSTKPKILNYYSIYEKFIFKKISTLWVDKKLPTQDHIDEHNLTDGPNNMGIHMRIALKYLLGSETSEKSQIIGYDEKKWPVEKLSRMGIISFDSSGRPGFIHDSFAEYFVARHLYEGMKNSSVSRATVSCLLYIMTNQQFRMIRIFLNTALENIATEMLESFPTKGFKYLFIDHLKNTLKYNALHIIMEERLETLTLFILNTIETATTELLEKVLRQTMTGDKEVEVSKPKQISNLYPQKTHLNGSNTFQLAVYFNSKRVVEKIIHLLNFISKENQKWLIQNCNDEGENIFHCAAKNYKNDEKFITLVNYIKLNEVLTKNELKIILNQFDKNGNSVLDSVVFNNDENSLSEIFKIMNYYFDRPELINLVKKKNEKYGTTLLCVLAKNNKAKHVLTRLWGFIKDHLTDLREQKKFLQEKDNKGRNALHLAVQHNTAFTVVSLFKIINETLKEDSKNMIQELTAESENIFHCAAWRFIRGDMFSTLWECLHEKVLTTLDLKEMMQQKNNKLNGVLFLIVERNLDWALKYFLAIFRKFKIEDQREMFVNKEGINAKNLLGVTVNLRWKENLSVFNQVWNYAEKILESQDLLHFIQETDIFGSHALHFACSLGHKTLVEVLCGKIKKHLPTIQEQKEFFKKKVDIGESTIFQRAAWNVKDDKIITTLIKQLKDDVFTNDEIKKLLLEKDSNGNNVLLIKGDEKILHEFIDVLGQFFDIDEIQSFFTHTNNTKMNYLQVAAINNKNKLFHIALFDYLEKKYLEKKFQHDDISNMLLSRDTDGNNVYHLAVLYNTQEVCQLIWKFISKFFPCDQKQLLISFSSESKEIAQITLSDLLDQKEMDYADNVRILIDFLTEET